MKETESRLTAEQYIEAVKINIAVGRLSNKEQEKMATKRSKLPEPFLFNALRTVGRIAGALEIARKLRYHGVAWDIITDSTGVIPADLRKKRMPMRMYEELMKK